LLTIPDPLADLRKIVLSVPGELEDWAAKNSIARFNISEQQWKDNGAEIIHFSPADQKRYMDRIRKVGVDFLTNHKNAQVREVYAVFKKAVAETR
jgi:TRAP-type C4-dicarboxylate transport system substrate-binding protein